MYEKTYICTSCFHIQKRYKKSKCESCKSNMFHCDEWIAPTISLLNKKGYKTAYCCSGHPVSKSKYDDWQPLETYILFEEGIVSNFKNLPNDFYILDNPNTIRWQVLEYDKTRFPSRLDYEYHHEIIMALSKILSDLHKWVLDLSDLKQ